MCWNHRPHSNVSYLLWHEAITSVHVSWDTEARCVEPRGFTVCWLFSLRANVSTRQSVHWWSGSADSRRSHTALQSSQRGTRVMFHHVAYWGDLIWNGRHTLHQICLSHIDTFHSELPWAPGRISAENRLVWICAGRISFSSWVCICSTGVIIHVT